MSFERIDELLSNFASLSDATLIAGIDQQRVPVVRKVIAEKNKYFETLFGPDFREGSEKEITLESIDGPTLKIIVYYFYAGHVELTSENIANVLAAAAGMEIISLEEKCGEFLKRSLSEQNCLETFLLADTYCFDQLKKDALALVCANFENIPRAHILQIGGNHLNEILQLHVINATEVFLFNCVVEWVGHNRSERAKFVPDLVRSIRLEHMPGEFLFSSVHPFYVEHGLGALLDSECKNRVLASKPDCLRRCPTTMTKNIYFANADARGAIKIYKYTSQWDDFTTLPYGISYTNFGSVFHDGKLYIMGGYDPQHNEYSRNVECYDISTGTRKTFENLYLGRSNFQPIVFGRSIYIFGGKNSTGCLRQFQRLNLDHSYSTPCDKMPLELRDCFAIEMDKFIYVAGGFDNNGGRSNRVYCFDETKNSSHGIPWTLKTFANGRIDNIVLAKSEGKLYFMINNKHIHTYDPSQNIWTKIGSFAQSTDVFQIVDYFGQLYAFWYDSKQTGNEKSTFGRMKFLEECTLENSCKVIWNNSGLGLSFVY